MNILENYLERLNESDLSNKLSNYDVVTFKTDSDIKKGLLIFDKPPLEKCFLFILPNEQIASFHTVGMKFPIDILFYDKSGRLDSLQLDVKPGVKSIKSKNKVKYVVEIPK